MQSLVEAAPAMKVADLIQVDRALESWRDAGYDLSAAVGEVVDNSIEAGARAIRIETVRVTGERGKRGAKGSIGAIAVGDDGTGIAPDILPSSLTLGFSTRYGRREGLGRFGVGAKLAALSQARRVDIYTRPVGHALTFHTFLDLDRIQSGEQHFLEAESVDGFPAEYAHLMQDDEGTEVESGTLVVWSKVDRLEEGGRFGRTPRHDILDTCVQSAVAEIASPQSGTNLAMKWGAHSSSIAGRSGVAIQVRESQHVGARRVAREPPSVR